MMAAAAAWQHGSMAAWQQQQVLGTKLSFVM
jgi:hypothetical protein